MAIPVRGRLIGVDVGSVRIGLATCDADRIISSPLEIYTRRTAAENAVYFNRLVQQEMAVGFVVGLPISLNGTEGPKALECRAFGQWLHQATGMPVAFHDERFTTSLAEDAMQSAGLTSKQRKSRRDSLAAQLILQGYLEASV